VFVMGFIYKQGFFIHECKDMWKRWCQNSYWKLACQVYWIGYGNFACKKFNQTLQKDQWKFVFHAKFDLKNYNYCGTYLRTKYTHGIVIHISQRIPLIQA
jgi:hypothetical protein